MTITLKQTTVFSCDACGAECHMDGDHKMLRPACEQRLPKGWAQVNDSIWHGAVTLCEACTEKYKASMHAIAPALFKSALTEDELVK